ncbi:helix-turn-helix transcriptional regulator [Pseudothauera nasutitermitis]|uniref:Helix-turn-helix transcriptional regulator n=1 Tax=Pseudothauera nasutitermitis TaxID=2565930 RepID=A0A4S4B4S4_9RHOO|nr:helix-turn-helix transcriptional regulator [Pseudothauera nasutitermitis]THF67291.1 helix-turn-helix transcriptional regulator [Pseudothauera nasutitermitis]
MSEVAVEVQDEIHRLWDEITDFEVSQTDSARQHLQDRLCQMVGAWNSTWGGALRFDTDPVCDDLLQGWRVAVTQVLHPFEAQAENGPFKELQDRWNNRDMDPSFLLPMRNIGKFRTYGHRRDMPAEWFDGPVFHHYSSRFGTMDSVWVGFPLNHDAESHFGFYSRGIFTEQDIALLAYALRGIKWFHRQLMLTSGPLIAKAPLTPTERKVLRLLLTKASEKVIADQLGLAASTTHQHIVSLFRKFSVRSRAELMSLWLSHPF